MAMLTMFLGSVRRERQGKHVADFVAGKLRERRHEVHLLDPLEHPDLLALTDQFKTKPNPSADFRQVQRWVRDSDGYVAVSPEYNHGYSGALKSALDCFLEEYFFKPFALITYSQMFSGGVRAADQLRNVCAELGAPAIPISVPFPSVHKVFNAKGELQDPAFHRRVDRMVLEFEWYLDAMKAQRAKGTPY